jgi:glycosyltransferase involved in cell wall biosynthesis
VPGRGFAEGAAEGVADHQVTCMICILHGYLLEGSGSNLWTREIARSLCQQGEIVHLMAQENHPERYDFITEFRRYHPDGTAETPYRSAGRYSGRCVLHKPILGDLLPVYVHDEYEEFARVVPMVELTEPEIEDYLDRNVRVLLRVVRENRITALHANHSVLMSVVAQRVAEVTGIPYAIFPHGSALEYVVKRDARFLRRAREAFGSASIVFTIGDEIRQRVRDGIPGVTGMEEKFRDLHLGVDTGRFEPIRREARPGNIAHLRDTLERVPRGRTSAQTRRLRSSLYGGMPAAEMIGVFAEARAFDGKLPDADLESKLELIDWVREPTLLYVGRLIASKGVHSVLAALPLLLSERPDLRLLVVGHGPLREPLEAMLWAFEHGDRQMVDLIARRGRLLEDAHQGRHDAADLEELALFLTGLAERGELESYFEAARRCVRPDRVIFTGYLDHSRLRFLFPCCDAAVFPSVVKEAGPLVFLEALASGSFPVGTDFAGMRASIDSIADALPNDVVETMRISSDPARTVEDIVRNVPLALELAERYRDALHRVARDRYDWSAIARKLHDELEAL